MNEIVQIEKSEERWIRDARQGDLLALERLISQYEKKIYPICLRILEDSNEAYDATQEVCIKVWKQLGQFRGDAKFETWIYRMATNTCIDLLRKRKRKPSDAFLFVLEDLQEFQKEKRVYNHWEDMSDQMMEREKQKVLWQGINELKEEHRIMIVLREIEGYSYEEIAAYLHLSVGTVKSRLSRARIQLKKILEQNKEPYQSFFVK